MNKGFPEEGWTDDAIKAHLEGTKRNDIDWKAGRSWSLMYRVDEAHQSAIEAAYTSFFSENFISPVAFSSLRALERDVVDWSASLLHAPDGYEGLLTGGGSESIFLVVLAARDRARKRGIRNPELVMPATAHPAFNKAADWLDVRIRICPVDDNQLPDVERYKRLIHSKTILLIASAPSYPHGVLDPIDEIGALAHEKGILFHVDACVGGYMLPWVEKLGYPIPNWDFRVPGVTSISADLHKFGYAAKNCSLLLYRSSGILDHQIYVRSDWAGGVYATAGLLGTRPGGAIAAAWTSIRRLGQQGFLAIAKRNMEAAEALRRDLLTIPEIELVGTSSMNILAYRTKQNRPDLFILADYLAEQGWQVDRQHKPLSIHITVMQHNQGVLDQYIADVKAGLSFAKQHPERSGEGEAVMYGLLARLPSEPLVKRQVKDVVLDWYQSDKTNDLVIVEGTSSYTQPKVPTWQSFLNNLLLRWYRWRQK
ncbi:MAG: aspartate aminotransferase family protein [Saprospiraceae bacterium]|nr:aspartate aminotransferase family protein [Saprospiraceae bacterium]